MWGYNEFGFKMSFVCSSIPKMQKCCNNSLRTINQLNHGNTSCNCVYWENGRNIRASCILVTASTNSIIHNGYVFTKYFGVGFSAATTIINNWYYWNRELNNWRHKTALNWLILARRISCNFNKLIGPACSVVLSTCLTTLCQAVRPTSHR